MSTKYFVHGGGRWRELDLSSGCVNGWGRVQWVSVRRGRLVAARRRRVLQALSALAAGCPSRARDGPRLPLYRELEEVKPVQIQHPSIQQQPIDHHSHCCCGHNLGCKKATEQKKTVADLNTTVDACTQVDPPISNKIVTHAEIHSNINRKRKYSYTSTDSNKSTAPFSRKVHNKSYQQIVRRHSNASSDTVISKQTNFPTKELIISEDDVIVLRSCIEKNILFPEADLNLFDSNDEYKTRIFYRLNPLVNVERSSRIKKILQGNREDRGSSQDNVTIDEFVSQLGLQSVKDIKKTRRYKTRNTIVRNPKKEDPTMKPLNRDILSRSSSPDNHNLHRHSVISRPKKRKSRPLSSSGSNIETDKENNDTNKKETNNIKSSLDDSRQRCRQKNGRFKSTGQRKSRNSNQNESHKNINKKPKLLLDDSISESRPRLRDRSIVVSSDSDTHNTTVTNSNNGRRESKRLSSDKKSSESAKKTEKPETKKAEKKLVNRQMELFFKKKSGSPQKKVIASKIRARPVPRSGRVEYSAVEDASIVRWLRAETSRAARVNGNQLWRQLENEYSTLTNIKRSWHSLRNRYLRGILPALHQLPLAASVAAHLRAAAHHGELKSRHRSVTRHPLFPAPTLGASSRIQTVSKSPTASPPRVSRRSLRDAFKQKVPESSPSYSDVTRRFRSRSSLSPPTIHSSPNQAKNKTRKLYNPK